MSKRRVHYYFALLLGKAHEDGRFLVANEDPNDIVQDGRALPRRRGQKLLTSWDESGPCRIQISRIFHRHRKQYPESSSLCVDSRAFTRQGIPSHRL